MGTAAVIPGMEMVGESQQVFSEMKKARYEELMAGGQVKPFTVINFNWFVMSLEGELARYRIPSPEDNRLPKDVQRVSVGWSGQDRTGHLLTLREPHLYGKMTNASAQNGDLARAIPERSVAEYLPIAIAYSFLEHYSPIFVTRKDKIATAPPKDARRTYGVLVFEGDMNTIMKELAIMKGPHPDAAKINVPVARVITVGRLNKRIYETVSYSLRTYLDQMFRGQLNFAKLTIAKAQGKWSETQTVRDISESDRTWYRWAIAHGYAEQPKQGEKHWLNELISVDGMRDAGATEGAVLRKCQACRKVEPEADTPFCTCGAPIDTFATYMAGHPVADAWLMALKGDERQKALAERKRRAQGFGEAEPRGAYKGRGSAAGKGKKPEPEPEETLPEDEIENENGDEA